MSAPKSFKKQPSGYVQATTSSRPQLSRLEIVRRERSRAWWLRFSIIAGCVLVLLVGNVFLLRAPGLQLQRITVAGTHVIVPEEIKAAAERFVSGNFLWVLPKRNILLYPKAKLEAYLQAAFPRIETITIDTVDRHSLAITVTERGSVYLWCAAGDCYYVDDAGLVFAKAPYFSGSIFFKFTTLVIGKHADETPIGGHVLEPELFSHVITLLDSCTALGFKPVRLETGPDASFAFVLETDDPTLSPKILFKGTDDPKVLFSNLRAALKTEALANVLKDDLKKVDYLDLRFAKKVYYKFLK